MSETSPLGTVSTLKAKHLGAARRGAVLLENQAGPRPSSASIWKSWTKHGQPLPHDGVAFGDLLVRGPFIASDYFGTAQHRPAYGWRAGSSTGDVATIDPDGFMNITDRSKDVIKIGRRVDFEHRPRKPRHRAPRHSRGGRHRRAAPQVERAPAAGSRPQAQPRRIRPPSCWPSLDGKIAPWWKPDAVEFVAQLPHTATGKLLKTQLRKDFADYELN